MDFINRVQSFHFMSAAIKIALSYKTRKYMEIKFYETMAVPSRLHVYEMWAMTVMKI